ncbi:hypothetical protein AURDEDRAFT_76131 [Auricularia subglabra TFB-10046 SS5]|uniref:CxC2-like cysteine cluster KDZ transposase-associated domain-containing protein n=1 Tax=Auricularia subglabra (strain TFB-10046 / SS5) TaxID=717982 RepID=J0D6L9_AURST|nr:hypothetical protein AURDEDRAFT_76131 [Auricularia subglabra TFB-10046 SS5]
MYEREYDARLGTTCSRCGGVEAAYKCFECFQAPPLCKSCIKDAHTHAPFHEIHEWTGSHLRKVSLSEIGFVIHLGHDGEVHDCGACSSCSRETCTMTIVHGGGIREMNVLPCLCGDSKAEGAQAMSLWRAGLFPATFKKPQTAISVEALSNFHVLTLSAKTNATAFCTYLRRRTDYWSRDSVKDRTREFFMSFRMYCFLNNLMRNGLDVPAPGQALEPGSMAAFCPACPQPEINLDPKWQERERRLRSVRSYLGFL